MSNKVKIAYWIHDEIEYPESVTGKLVLPSCKCSNCGYSTGMEKKICPRCKCEMRGHK